MEQCNNLQFIIAFYKLSISQELGLQAKNE